MLLTTLFAVFVLGFVILAAVGHVLLLQAFLHRPDDLAVPGGAQPARQADEPAAANVPPFEHKEAA